MAVGYDRIARDIAFTLEVKSPKIFQNIFLNNGVLVMLGSKGRVKLQKGGNRFDERTHLGQNSNVAHRSKFGEIGTLYQNNFLTAYYGQSVVSGAVPINFVEVDQNAGPSQIDSMAQNLVDELMQTFPNKVADALMATTSGANDPLSIVEELEATAYGSQTRTTGGITRSDHTGASDATDAWQTQYDATGIADLGSAAGLAAFSKFLWDCSPGGSAMSEQPDMGITTTGVFAKLSGNADVLRRFGTNDTLAKFGFNNLMVNQCSLIADRNVGAGICYVMNTNYAKVQVLGGGKTKTTENVKVIGDGATDVSLQVCKPVEAHNKLEYIVKAYLVYNLTFGGLRQHGHLASITEA